MLLTAVKRLEAQVAANVAAAPFTADTVSPELRSLLDAIRGMQSELDAASLAMQVAKLGSLLEVIQQRLEIIVALPRADAPTTPDLAAMPAPAAEQPATKAELFPVTTEAAFAEPETPAMTMSEPDLVDSDPPALSAAQEQTAAVQEPVTAAPEPPAMAVEEPPMQDASPVAVPEIYWYDAKAEEAAAQPAKKDAVAGLAIAAVIESAVQPAEETPAVTVIRAGTMPPPTPFTGEDFSDVARNAKLAHQDGPLSDIMALSEEERLALFT
jgi:hypothetical protein